MIRALRPKGFKARASAFGEITWDTADLIVDFPGGKERVRFSLSARRRKDDDMVWRHVWEGNQSRADMARQRRYLRGDDYALFERIIANGFSALEPTTDVDIAAPDAPRNFSKNVQMPRSLLSRVHESLTGQGYFERKSTAFLSKPERLPMTPTTSFLIDASLVATVSNMIPLAVLRTESRAICASFFTSIASLTLAWPAALAIVHAQATSSDIAAIASLTAFLTIQTAGLGVAADVGKHCAIFRWRSRT